MITTLTDGLAILAVRYRFFDKLLAIGSFAGLVLGVIVLPLAVIGWGVWAIFFSGSDEAVEVAAPAPVEAVTPQDSVTKAKPAAPQPAPEAKPTPAPAPGTTSSVATANAVLLESDPPKSREAHLKAAKAAVRARQSKLATHEMKMVMQHDLQQGRELSKAIRDLMRDAVLSGIDTSDIGNFVTLASEKYKSRWPQAEQRTYEMMRSILERQRN